MADMTSNYIGLPWHLFYTAGRSHKLSESVAVAISFRSSATEIVASSSTA
ncbi:hypothetical protein HMPREF0307_01724 [Corynebacterium sp. DNF00584]|nr:hypothetical protein HMPREF0307_01724 [Corynebacterium sp. DNF00584]